MGYIADAATAVKDTRDAFEAQYANQNPSRVDPERLRLAVQVAELSLKLATLEAGMNPFQPVGCHH